MSFDEDGDDAGAQIEAQLGEAISTVLRQHDKSMVLKWIALIETMDGDGDRGLWTMSSDNLKAWDTAGMLTHAIHLQQMQIMQHIADED